MQTRVGYHHRLVTGGLEGIGDYVGAIHDRHRSTADDFEDVVGVDDRSRVFIESQSDQRG